MLSYFYAIFVQFSDKLITLVSFIVKVHQTKGADTEMKDISDMLANMMGEKDCSSVSALFLLNEEDKEAWEKCGAMMAEKIAKVRLLLSK